MVERRQLRKKFLESLGLPADSFEPLSSDASFRRYFRSTAYPAKVLMDAPPAFEDTRPFIAITHYLRAQGFSAPDIIAQDVADGFLLLEDFGDDRFSRLLRHGNGHPGETTLYDAAVDVLIALHESPPPRMLPIDGGEPYTLPDYDDDALLDEALLFTDWYLPAVTGRDTDKNIRDQFAILWRDVFADCHRGARVLTLRDYHADNLMWLPQRRGIRRVGLLDFQDALIGPPAYDLVSLVQDARRDVSSGLQRRLITRYLSGSHLDETDKERFERVFYILGAQRNTKIIGIFTRLWKRDGKPAYLDLIPRVWETLAGDLGHPALQALQDWFEDNCPPRYRVAPDKR